ncbi:hypothetical protein GCM10010521_17120 [Streptomyces rameus]|uniref:Secreted protein n=1 Tax=Streptomyces rameus TaxID=68261 RepID=A0ABP6MZU1_9ACTN
MLLVACIIGASGGWISSHINHNDGPPSCAKNFIGVRADDAETRNKMVDCDTTVETWCDKHHPADGADCYVSVEETGEYTIGRD